MRLFGNTLGFSEGFMHWLSASAETHCPLAPAKNPQIFPDFAQVGLDFGQANRTGAPAQPRSVYAGQRTSIPFQLGLGVENGPIAVIEPSHITRLDML